MSVIYDRVALIGLGLIAGSMAHAMRDGGLAGEIVGYARSAETRDIAREIGTPQDQPARLQSRNVRDQLLSAGRVADRVAAADPTGAEGDP